MGLGAPARAQCRRTWCVRPCSGEASTWLVGLSLWLGLGLRLRLGLGLGLGLGLRRGEHRARAVAALGATAALGTTAALGATALAVTGVTALGTCHED